MFTPAAVPDCFFLPPVEASYQSTVVPVAAVAERLTVPLPHREAFTGDVDAAGIAFTVAATVSLPVEMQLPDVFLASA